MFIDLKYHLTTLVAVFLALAVGILVGSSFIAGSSIQGLQREFVKLRAENREQQRTIEDMRAQIVKHAEFNRAVAPILVNRQLSWRQIAIIQTGDYSEATQSAKSILEEAGAKVVSVTTLSRLDSKSAQERAARAVELITGVTDEAEPITRVLEIMANCIGAGVNAQAMDVFEKKGLVTTVGEYTRRVPYVVLVGGSKQKASRQAVHVDLPLIDRLKAAGVITIVGAEPLDAGTSYISTYHRKAIPTVDNVDQPMGQVALVFAVAGETGNFGMKKSADRVVPIYLESGQWRYGFPR